MLEEAHGAHQLTWPPVYVYCDTCMQAHCHRQPLGHGKHKHDANACRQRTCTTHTAHRHAQTHARTRHTTAHYGHSVFLYRVVWVAGGALPMRAPPLRPAGARAEDGSIEKETKKTDGPPRGGPVRNRQKRRSLTGCPRRQSGGSRGRRIARSGLSWQGGEATGGPAKNHQVWRSLRDITHQDGATTISQTTYTYFFT